MLKVSPKVYSKLGFKYWASHQSSDITAKRISEGECYVAVQNDVIIATILLKPPCNSSGHPHYDRGDVASIHQFAVEPDLQKSGVGSRLLEFVESRAIKLGANELACDTAEGASHLIDMYKRRGYRKVGKASWDGTNYDSFILSKLLHR